MRHSIEKKKFITLAKNMHLVLCTYNSSFCLCDKTIFVLNTSETSGEFKRGLFYFIFKNQPEI